MSHERVRAAADWAKAARLRDSELKQKSTMDFDGPLSEEFMTKWNAVLARVRPHQTQEQIIKETREQVEAMIRDRQNWSR